MIAAGVVAGVRAGGAARAAALAVGFVAFVPGLQPLLPVAVLLQAFAGRPAPETWARLLAETGFRVYSECTIAGEWKDGTQQYFNDAFAREWDARMRVLEPERYHRLSRGRLLALAKQYGADYIVLPAPRCGQASTSRTRTAALPSTGRVRAGHGRW